LILGLSLAALIAPKALAQNACATAAFEDYNRANVALLTQAAPILSIDQTIQQRRLEEQYCLRFARCIVGDPTTSSLGLMFTMKFSSCLETESLEKYDAKSRSDD
jgi:hypothetical protein